MTSTRFVVTLHVWLACSFCLVGCQFNLTLGMPDETTAGLAEQSLAGSPQAGQAKSPDQPGWNASQIAGKDSSAPKSPTEQLRHPPRPFASLAKAFEAPSPLGTNNSKRIALRKTPIAKVDAEKPETKLQNPLTTTAAWKTASTTGASRTDQVDHTEKAIPLLALLPEDDDELAVEFKESLAAPTRIDETASDDTGTWETSLGVIEEKITFNDNQVTRENADTPKSNDTLGGESTEKFPIDLPTVLGLAGAENWSVRLAYERISEARARLDGAEALWLPSLMAGIGYNKHDGQIQDTAGQVLDVSRNSLFVGGGAGLGGMPLTGGSNGPPRLMVNLSITDAIFQKLVERQFVNAKVMRHSVTYNDTLLEASLAYYDLVGSQGEIAFTQKNLADAEKLLKLTQGFVDAGKGSRADTTRIETAANVRRQEIITAEKTYRIAAAELARILQLDPETALFALEDYPVAVELVPESNSLSGLVGLGVTSRPEIAEFHAEADGRFNQMRAEQLRPLIPHLQVSTSAGGFGGGVGGYNGGLGGRGDFDIQAIWQIRNLGFGNQALRDERRSQFQQSMLKMSRSRDRVTTDVTQAYYGIQAERKQIALAETNMKTATESYQQNINRIRALEGLPLEALQSIHAIAAARRALLRAIVDYNKAQAKLMWATGQHLTQQ